MPLELQVILQVISNFPNTQPYLFYKSFCHAIISAAMKSIPRGCCSQYISCWSAATYENYKSTPIAEEAQFFGDLRIKNA